MFAKGILTAALLTAGAVSQVHAQSSTVVTGNGQTTIVPDAATSEKGVSPIATEVVSEYPAFNQTMNNDAISTVLLEQGFKDIHILREGSLMTVTGTREGQDINLVYNLVEGRLIKVNGERILSDAEKTQRGSDGQNATETTSDEDSADPEGGDQSGTDTGDGDAGSTGDDASGSTDGSSTDGGDAGSEGAGDSGDSSDGGADGSDGGGTGSDGSGSDGTAG